MINSHFIPQFILRHFCVDNNVQYCDIQNKRVEPRTTRTVFSEGGYYPEELEHDLCSKVETQFANLLNNKIVREKRKIILSDEEMLLLKKYLLVSVFRYKSDELENELRLLGLGQREIETFSGNFYENIKKILNCKTKEEACSYCYPDSNSKANNSNLWAHMTDILHSYTLFVKTNYCKEDFIIPDRGWASYSGPFHVKKLMATLDAAVHTGDPTLFQLSRMISPHDYSIFPLTRDLSVMTMSIFFKLLTEGLPEYIKLDERNISQMLGFGSRNLIKPPTLKKFPENKTEYHCEIQQLTEKDVIFLNSLLLSNADNFFAYAEKSKVERSLTQYKKYDFAILK